MFFFPQNSAMKKIPMFASFSMMLLSLAQNVMSKEECYIKTNSCSVPGGLPFFYKTTFTPACDKHDVCYSCVRIQKSVISNYVHNPFTQFFFMRFLVFIAYVNWAYRGRYRDIGSLPFTRSVRKINKIQLTLFTALLVFFWGLKKIG